LLSARERPVPGFGSVKRQSPPLRGHPQHTFWSRRIRRIKRPPAGGRFPQIALVQRFNSSERTSIATGHRPGSFPADRTGQTRDRLLVGQLAWRFEFAHAGGQHLAIVSARWPQRPMLRAQAPQRQGS
jgi:hypothetical protein